MNCSPPGKRIPCALVDAADTRHRVAQDRKHAVEGERDDGGQEADAAKLDT